ncbi:hypothetical protein [Mucilaginibacter humi]|uniref:hypothetical protein n=1 Tax=Mucilaginibacter humi TaxID=2732510 RepID=UPI001FE812E5|nr:hypothetical protein [Mucilaginibacter humi]
MSSEHFSARIGEPYLLNVASDIAISFDNYDRNFMNTPEYSGPGRMKRSFEKHKGSDQELINIKNIFEYDYWEIKKADFKTRSKIMIHYWLNSWIPDEVKQSSSK